MFLTQILPGQYGNTGARLIHLLTKSQDKSTVIGRHTKPVSQPGAECRARRPRKITPKKHEFAEDVSNEVDDAEDDAYTAETAAESSDNTPAFTTKSFQRRRGRPCKHPLKGVRHRKQLPCKDCRVTYWTPSRLKEHLRIHTEQRPFECDQCKMKFRRATHLKKHCMIHTGKRPFVCDHCGKTFTNNASLKEHMYTHTGERPHKCPKCTQSFTCKVSLAEHVRMHTSEKPFQCTQCDSKFIRKAELRAHMLFHTRDKPYLCQTCGAKFRHNTAFNEHVRIHTGSKPFVCQHCAIAFTCRSTLKKHMRLHTGEKPYKGIACGTSFAQRTSLMCHIKKHPGMTLPSLNSMEHKPKEKGEDVCLYPVVRQRKQSNENLGEQHPPPHVVPTSSHMELLMSDSGVSQTNSMKNMEVDDASMSNEASPHGDNSHHHQPQTDHLRMAGDHTSQPPMGSAAWANELPAQVPTFSAYDQNTIHRGHQMCSQPFAGFLPIPSQMPPAFPDQQRFPLDYRFSMN